MEIPRNRLTRARLRDACLSLAERPNLRAATLGPPQRLGKAPPLPVADEATPRPRVDLAVSERGALLLELCLAERLGERAAAQDASVEVLDERHARLASGDLPERREHRARTRDVEGLDEPGGA